MDHHRLLNNDDVLTEILSYLPLQSLLRFKTVSKSWRDIIDSSSFSKLHVQNRSDNNNNDDSVFLQFIYGTMNVWELSMLFPDRGKSYNDFPAFQEFFNNNNQFCSMRFAGPVNGLICIHENHSSGKNGPIAVCNPSLGKIKILPISPISSSFQNSRSIMSRYIGFGFDYVTKDYKIVRLLSCFGQRIYVEVYSGTTNTWRDLDTDTLDQILYIKKRIRSSYKNGSFAHWMGLRRTNMRGCYEKILLSFDMHNEVFQTILMPGYEKMGKFVKSKIFAKDDSFVLFVRTGDNKWLKIYELKSEGNKGYWTHVSIVGPFLGVPRPVALWNSDGVVLRYYYKKNKLIFYDYCTQEIRRCFEMPENRYRFKIFEYKGSLISP